MTPKLHAVIHREWGARAMAVEGRRLARKLDRLIPTVSDPETRNALAQGAALLRERASCDADAANRFLGLIAAAIDKHPR